MTIDTAELLNTEQAAKAPGTILGLRRKELGWSEREVAERLRLLPQQVRDLEDNNFDKFNAQIFAKGYLRSYAKLVDLDENGLIGLYDQYYQGSPNPASEIASPLQELPAQQASARRYLGVVAALLIVVLLWFFNASGGDGVAVSESKPEAAQAEPQIEDIAPVDSTPGLVSLAPDVTEASGETEESVAGDLGVSDQGVAEEAVNFSEGEQSLEVASDTDATAVGSLLKLEFRGDCWVEIRDADGSTIVADLKKANDVLELTGKAPFSVLLGDATVVAVSYNAKPVTVNPNARNQSARLTIGSASDEV